MTPSGEGVLLGRVAAYYSDKVRVHGAAPRGVDWNGTESQTERFRQLLDLIGGGACSLNDLGCGYGALLDLIALRETTIDYLGIDVSAEMIEQARLRHSGSSRVRFMVGSAPDRVADYTVASGIFNVRLDTPASEWHEYIEATLDMMNRCSARGFAFNCLTSYSDAERMRDYLHYADPCALFDHCKRRYARDVALLHDYGLYEFTILVRKALP